MLEVGASWRAVSAKLAKRCWGVKPFFQSAMARAKADWERSRSAGRAIEGMKVIAHEEKRSGGAI